MAQTSKNSVESWRREIDRAERVLGRIGPDDICCEGLTPRQASMLRILADREGARLMDLAAAAEITASAITRVIEKLEARGLVRRVRGGHSDGRAAMVEITVEGRRVRGRIDEMVDDRSRAVMQAIPATQRAEVLAALRLLNNALEAAGCCGPNYNCESNGSLVKIGNTRSNS
ncbi:MAG: MarR family winged helix-turn-helix transcriptional regulator [Terriglobales bacterium]